MLEIPSTPLQNDALREAAKQRNTSVGEYVLDAAMTYATTHLSRGLADWVRLEQQYIGEGNATECGATRKLTTADGQAAGELGPCVRIRGHQSDGVAGRESHGFWSGDELNTWV